MVRVMRVEGWGGGGGVDAFERGLGFMDQGLGFRL